MTTKILSLTVALILTGHISPAYAQETDGYQTPEDILLLQMEEGSFPRNARASDALAERQQQRTNTYAKQQQEEQERLHAAAEAEKQTAEEATEEDEEEVAATEDDEVTEDSGKATLTLSPEELRLFLRLTQPKTLPSTAALHSGAPLAPSGLPEVATAAVLALAVGWTLWRAKRTV